MADSGKQRLLEQFRDASEGERRNNYGGDQIEDAALYAGRVMTRGAETFVRTRMEELTSMRETAEPTLYDLPLDLTAPPEVTAPAELSPPVSQTIPELPPATPEAVLVPAETPAIAEATAPLELPPRNLLRRSP